MGASRDKQRPKIPNILCLDRPFQAVATSGRICFEGSGVFRGATHYRHLLRIEHLRPMSLFVQGLETIDQPYRFDDAHTHQFWCWYQRRTISKLPPASELLFRFQVDLGSERIAIAQNLPRRTASEQKGRLYAIEQTYKRLDACAAHIGEAIAARMWSLKEPPQDPNGLTLIRQEGIDPYPKWFTVIERAYMTCYVEKKRLSEDSVSGIILDK